jgi:hypothetical protein
VLAGQLRRASQDSKQWRHRLERRNPLIRWFGLSISDAFVVRSPKGCVGELLQVGDEFLRDGEARGKTLGQAAANCPITPKM